MKGKIKRRNFLFVLETSLTEGKVHIIRKRRGREERKQRKENKDVNNYEWE